MTWIKVEERLPKLEKDKEGYWFEVSKLVLIYDKNLQDAKIGYLKRIRKVDEVQWQEHYGTSCDCCAREAIKPTHWMPLPEPPESK